MKIGLLSDIHANLPALNAALGLLQAERPDVILCAGDLVDGGGHEDDVVAIIRERAIPCVLGNHDHAVILHQEWLDKSGPDGNRRKHVFAPETMAYLQALPRTRRFRFEDVELLLAHGTPNGRFMYLYPNNPDAHFKEVVVDANADVVILGHTHVPMCRQVDGTWIVNPGSVDGNRDTFTQTCAILELTPFSVSIFDVKTRKVIRTCGG